MALPIDFESAQNRAIARKLQVMENMVRNHLESGGPLTAQEVMDGVRLSHEEFLQLAGAAMPELNRRLSN